MGNFVLVGASYGGPVISGVAAELPERVRHLVFVDGLVPLKTHDEPLPAQPPDALPGTYVRCDKFLGFDAQMEPALRRGYDTVHLDAGNDVQVTDAPALAELLNALT